jgi:hypothetical protein
LAPFGQAVSEEKIFLTLANQKQELPLAAIFVGGMGRNEETKLLYELTVTSLFNVGILKCDIFFFFFLYYKYIKCQECNKNKEKEELLT